METILAFFVYSLATGLLFFLARFILEAHEFRYMLTVLPASALLAALFFWGMGALDPTLSALDKFFSSGALILALILGLHAQPRWRRRLTLTFLLSLASAALAIPLALLAVWIFSLWFPSHGFTPPPTDNAYEALAPASPARTCSQRLPALLHEA